MPLPEHKLMLGLWSGLYKLMLNKSTGHWELLHGNNVPNACTTLGRDLKRGTIKVKKSEDDSCLDLVFLIFSYKVTELSQ